MVGKIVTAAVFVALIGWDLWEATGNMIGLPGFYEALSVGEDTPWFLLIPGVVIPVVVLAAGLWWGWRRASPVARLRTLVHSRRGSLVPSSAHTQRRGTMGRGTT